jgi:hypothetical protein
MKFGTAATCNRLLVARGDSYAKNLFSAGKLTSCTKSAN